MNDNNALDIFSKSIDENNTSNKTVDNNFIQNQNFNESKVEQKATFFQKSIPNNNSNSVKENKKFNPFGDGNVLQAQTVTNNQVIEEKNVNYNTNTNSKTIDSVISGLNSEKKDNFVISDESLLKIYIGNNYDQIMNTRFNFSAFFFTAGYFLYRKLYISGVLILSLMMLLCFFLHDYILLLTFYIYISLFCGFIFNKIYINSAQKNIDKIKNKFENNKIKDVCIKKGRTSIINSIIVLIIYISTLLFIIID